METEDTAVEPENTGAGTLPPEDEGPSEAAESAADPQVLALRRENAKYRTRAKEMQAELEKLREATLSEQERAISDAQKQARAEAEAEYLPMLMNMKVKVLATGILRDPDDARLLTDLPIDADDAAIVEALHRLVEEKPHLGVEQQPASVIAQGRRGGSVSGPTDGNSWLRKDILGR